MGGKIAAYVFTVVIPVVVAAMLPHIGPEIGFPIILVSLIIGLSDFAWMYAKAHHRKPNMLLIGGTAFGALILGGCAIAFFLSPKGAEPAIGSQLDGEIQITVESGMYPSVIPQNRLFELQLNNNFVVEGGAFLSFSQAAGTAAPTRDPSLYPIYGLRLRISNYGKTPIINATVTFPIQYLEVIKIEKGIQSGKIIKSVSATTNPFSIGPGENIDIYAMNYSTDAFAEVLIPQTAEGYAAGSDKRETFRLIPPVLAARGLPPFVPKSPPAPPRQGPGQQGKPGKT